MRVWQGRPHPLGATWDGQGVNVAVFSEVATQVRAVPVRRDRRDASRAGRAAGVDRRRLARLLPRPAARAALRPARRRAVSTRRRGRASTRTSCCSTRTRRRSGATCATTTPVRLHARRRERPERSTRATARRSRRWPRSSTRRSTGATIARRGALWPTRVIYELHVKGFTQLHPGVPAELRGTYAGLALARRDRAPRRAGRQRASSCCRCTTASASASSSTRGCRTTGATTRSASSRPIRGSPPPAIRHGVVQRVQGDGGRAARGRTSRCSSTSSTTTPPRATSTGPTLSFRGLDNAAYYHLADDPRFTLRLHRHAATR